LPDVFSNKNTNLGKFWRALDWNVLIYFMAISNILGTFGIFYEYWVQFVTFFSGLGIIYQDKSGNPGPMHAG
jgi:hypothetical protein